MGRTLRYDYINIVDYQQDKILHHLNDVIKTVDSDYVLGTHEFGERCRYIFSHWDELYQYSEIYIALAPSLNVKISTIHWMHSQQSVLSSCLIGLLPNQPVSLRLKILFRPISLTKKDIMESVMKSLCIIQIMATVYYPAMIVSPIYRLKFRHSFKIFKYQDSELET